jgi:hypothetical protein
LEIASVFYLGEQQIGVTKRGAASASLQLSPSVDESYDASWMQKIQLPVARWISIPYQRTDSDSVNIGVFAKAIAGIEKVELYHQYGDVADLRLDEHWSLFGTATSESTRSHHGMDVDAFWFTFDAAAELDSGNTGKHRFYAKIFAKNHDGTNGIRSLRYGIVQDEADFPADQATLDFWKPIWGEITSSFSGSVTNDIWRNNGALGTNQSPCNGEYTHVVYVDDTSSDVHHYVDWTNGSDSTGNGTSENPYKTLQKAYSEYTTTTFGEIRLKQGTHHFDAEQSFSNGPRQNNCWRDVVADPIAPAGSVIVEAWKNASDDSWYTGSNKTFSNFERVCFRGIKFYGTHNIGVDGNGDRIVGKRLLSGNARCAIWLDQCVLENDWNPDVEGDEPNSGTQEAVNAGAGSFEVGQFGTQVTQRKMDGTTAFLIMINGHYDRIAQDVIRCQMAYGATVQEINRGVRLGLADSHADLWQFYLQTGDRVNDWPVSNLAMAHITEVQVDGVWKSECQGIFFKDGSTSLQIALNSAIDAAMPTDPDDADTATVPVAYAGDFPFQDLYFGDINVRLDCGVLSNGDSSTNHTSGLKWGASVANNGQAAQNVLVENCAVSPDSAFQHPVDGYPADGYGNPFNNGYMYCKDVVLRNFTHQTALPDQDSYPTPLSDLTWYGGSAYPEEAGFPAIGGMPRPDRDLNSVDESSGNFRDEGFPSFPWYSKNTGIRYEGDFIGLPPE